MDVPISQAPTTDLVIVWDRTRNAVAARPIKNIVNGNWDVAAKEFARLGLIEIRVEHEGKPVKTAQVSAKSGEQTESRLIGSDSNGTATYFGFREGEIKVEAKVLAETGEKTLKQSFDVRANRADADIRLIVAVPDKVPTVESEAGTDSSSGASAEAGKPEAGQTKVTADSPAPNPLGQAVVYLLGIAVAGGAAYAAFRLLKKDPAALKDQLEKLGVQIPSATPDDDAPPAAPAPITPEPVQPIVLDAVPAPMAAGSTPKLVSPLGAFEVRDGENLIGREDGLWLSLVGESTVSRRHAALVLSGGAALVRDLGSTNGTFVNGMKVTGEAPIRPGDELQVGSVRLRFES